MGRREIEGAGEKILLATIEVAGNETRGAFSTKEVALRAGVSEFTVFSHFHDKEQLLETVDAQLFADFIAAKNAIALAHPNDFEGFFNGLLDYFLGKKSALRFIGNYSLLFPRQGELASYDAFKERILKETPLFPSYLPNEKGELGLSLSLYSLREIVQDSLYFVSEVPDTPEIRHAMFVLFSEGANAFVKVAE